jgi:hypothetical protein
MSAMLTHLRGFARINAIFHVNECRLSTAFLVAAGAPPDRSIFDRPAFRVRPGNAQLHAATDSAVDVAAWCSDLSLLPMIFLDMLPGL